MLTERQHMRTSHGWNYEIVPKLAITISNERVISTEYRMMCSSSFIFNILIDGEMG